MACEDKSTMETTGHVSLTLTISLLSSEHSSSFSNTDFCSSKPLSLISSCL